MTFASPLGRAIIGALLTALALVGCSAIQLGYNNLSELTYWWVDGYIDFTDEQAPRVRTELARLHQWHRQSELPRLVQTLQQAEQLAPSDLTGAQVCKIADDLRQRLLALRGQAEPAVLATARGLQPEQLAQMATRHERNNRDYRRKWIRIDPDQLAARRMEQFQEHAERLYGRLEPAQRAMLRERLAQTAFDPARVLAERQRRQADTLQVLRRIQAPGLEPAQAQALVAGWLDRLQTPPDAATRRQQQERLQQNCAVFASVHNAGSAEQRQQAAGRLRGWRRDLNALAGRP